MSTSTSPIQTKPAGLNRDGVRRIFQVFSILALYGLLLFVSAGRLDWLWAWVYLGIYFVGLLVNALLVLRRNPEVINQRGRNPEGQKRWDKIILSIYGVVGLSALVLAGLDAGRFGWSAMPLGLQLAAIPVGLFAYGITTWTMLHNSFLAQTVAVQEQRGHRVATSGPYQYLRHPMYFSMELSWLTTPLLLGSWWSYIPAALAMALILLRTALEDRTLQAELDGYQEYAQQVRYRMLPGVW